MKEKTAAAKVALSIKCKSVKEIYPARRRRQPQAGTHAHTHTHTTRHPHTHSRQSQRLDSSRSEIFFIKIYFKRVAA